MYTTCRGKSNFAFVVNNTVSPCTSGPTIWSILNNTSTGLQFQFDGVGVFGITWRIKQGSTVVRNGVIKHTSIAQPGEPSFNNSTPVITFAALAAGSYTFEIEGFTCSSAVTSKPLTITTDVPLAFVSGSPSVTGSAGNYSLALKINKSGAYNTVVLNTTTGNYYQNGSITYTANTDFVINSLPVGQYYIKVGTLESNINIQNTGGSPCTLGPNLSNVISPSQTALSFLFDGVNVTAITWRIKQAGNTLRNGVVYPSNNTPIITYNELPVGSYSLEIEGNNCTSAVSSANFTISALPQGNNAGVLVTNIGNRYIGIINARNAQASVNPSNGAIKLNYDEISVADQGSKQVKCWLLDSELCEVKASEVNALRSSNGLLLPDGNYHFYLYYAATTIASTFEQLRPNLYALFLNPDTWPTNSKNLEEIIIEVKTNI